MPEGPEIWRQADALNEALQNQVLDDIYFAFDHLKDYEDRLVREKIRYVEARGKAMLIRFDNKWNIYSHNQLYGKWMVGPRGFDPDNNRQLRLALHSRDDSALLFSASEIEVLEDDELNDHPYLKKIGPDVVRSDTNIEDVLARFEDESFKNRKLTTLLLDQHFLSGPGNYLRSEILFKAGVPHTFRPRDCTPEQRRALAEATLTLARRSYQTKGLTVPPEMAEEWKENGESRKQYRFWVFNRDGQPCRQCGSEIQKTRSGGRRLYFCPQCQKNGKA